MKFTKGQEQAINCIQRDKHLQIIACAGSGKTRVLVERICHILQSDNAIKPENIIAFTFTEKAAAELKSRIDLSIKEKEISTLGMADMYVGTIHGFCLDFLQQECMSYQKYSILNEIQTKLFVQKNDKKHLNVNIPILGNAKNNLTLPKHTRHYLSIISIIREERLADHKDLPIEWKEQYDRYNKLFNDNCYFDFSMIVETAVKELENPERLEYIKDKIKYLIVDEYQDLNPLQEALLNIFYKCGVNICVVGDDDQTIYQWRGSNTDNFIQFPDRYKIPKEDLIYLDTNFRSTERIIKTAERIICKNVSRFAKEFYSGNSELKYQQNHDLFYREFEGYADEADFIADEIAKLWKAGMPLSEIAILTRKKIMNQPLLEALTTRKIPVIVEGVAELFDTPEARAAESIFGYIKGDLDKGTALSLWEEAVPNLVRKDIEKGIKALDKSKAKLDTWQINFQQIFRNFLQAIGFYQLVDTKDSERLAYNLGQFSVLLGDFETIHFKTKAESKLYYFDQFIKYLAQDAYAEGELLNMYIKPEAVQIMTIHKSKGLEFGAVFVPGLSKNLFPSKKHSGLGIQHYLDIENLVEGGDRYLNSTEEDERRLFYVAITRSKKFLYLCRAKTYPNTSGGVNMRDYRERSMFMQEALDIIDSPFVQTTPKLYEVPEVFKAAKKETGTVVNFSILNSYFQCPFHFKLDHFYGFQEELSDFLGFGRSMHNMIQEIHMRGHAGETLSIKDLPTIIDRHFHMPYLPDVAKEKQKEHISHSLNAYFEKYKDTFKNIEFVEQKIEIPLTENLLVTGRIDLIKNTQNGSVEIIDFKTSDSIPNTKEQLLIYAKGYEQLTGRKPDFYHVYNVDDNKTIARDAFTDGDVAEITRKIVEATENIKNNHLPKCSNKATCKTCNKRQFCYGESNEI